LIVQVIGNADSTETLKIAVLQDTEYLTNDKNQSSDNLCILTSHSIGFL